MSADYFRALKGMGMTTNRNNQRRGSQVEQIAAHRLVYLGFGLVCRISTPTAMIRGKRVFSGKAEGDLRAVGPGGVSVLCECKSRPDRLVFSDFEHHQVARLDEHQALGGISLVAWHKVTELWILPWDIMRAQGFSKGEGIGSAWAEKNQIIRGQL